MIPPSAARMIASAFSAACGFSIFAISGMSAPRDPNAALDGLQVLGAADEGHREQVDALLDREVDPVEVGAAGGRQGHLRPRHVQPLVGGDRARRPRPRSAPRRTSPRAPAGAPGRRRGRPRRPRRPPPAGPPTRPAAGRRRRSPRPVVSVSSEPAWSSTTPPSTSSIRSFGPGRSPSRPTSRPASCEASRAIATLAACSSRVPCEKLSRKTSAPARISSAIRSTERVAGPIVATILVRRRPDAAGSGRAWLGLGGHRDQALGPAWAQAVRAGAGGRARGGASGARGLGRRLVGAGASSAWM